MIDVALETSTRRPSVAARAEDRTVERRLDEAGSHASDLLPALESLLAELGGRPADIARVVVGLGPGSYTGLRVGVATAQGLARGAGATLLGIASGEALAFAICAPGEQIVHLLDARSREVYFAHYRRTESGVDVVVSPRVVPAVEVEATLPAGVRIVGDGTCADAAQLSPQTRRRMTTDRIPTAGPLLDLGRAHLAAGIAPGPPQGVLPLYLRPFAAKLRKR